MDESDVRFVLDQHASFVILIPYQPVFDLIPYGYVHIRKKNSILLSMVCPDRCPTHGLPLSM
jgi:hypothetical protein